MPHFSESDDHQLRDEVIEILYSLDRIEGVVSDMMDSELYGYVRNLYDQMAKFSCRMEILQGES